MHGIEDNKIRNIHFKEFLEILYNYYYKQDEAVDFPSLVILVRPHFP